ncbi:hypothetical protein KIMH_13330 [Bombiscardovia apis]|uniref:Uncharacterized protein n=1 Tax=Bombiscardovia apis TaxID=2932182 RepID=A0ABN6SIQ7_9BIFI|nr:hypothetical protein KIMH_13330 [Bombiscardovia apis]
MSQGRSDEPVEWVAVIDEDELEPEFGEAEILGPPKQSSKLSQLRLYVSAPPRD